MSQEILIDKTRDYVENLFKGEASGHDWWHVYRVWKMASEIARKEGGVDILVIELAALLHDIADHKFHNGDLGVGPRRAREWLISIGADIKIAEHVSEIISQISFKGAKVATPMSSQEGCIVQDADRLDAIGAIGIARTFAYGGHTGREMYNPEISPHIHDSFESYFKNNNPTFNHFYEKLLLLKERMNTTTGKEMAEKRHEYMQGYLDKFLREWEGLE